MRYIEGLSGGLFAYDTRIFECDWEVEEKPILDYFSFMDKLDELHVALHVNESTKEPVFEMDSFSVFTAFKGDLMTNGIHYYQQLIDAKHPILVYAGEYDAQDGPKTIDYWLKLLNFDGKEQFWNKSR